jgi:uncharacterized membrane protein YtjA (UPF0391 family)
MRRATDSHSRRPLISLPFAPLLPLRQAMHPPGAPPTGATMLHYAVVFFVIALIAAVLGFGGIAAGAAGIAKILFFVFLVLAIIAFITGRRP